MARLLVLVLLVAGAASAVSAQAPDAERLAAAESLLVQFDMPTLLSRSVDTVLQQQLAQNPALTPYADIMQDFFRRYMSWDALRAPMTRLYADAFTEPELREMIAFYGTETGRKAARLTPDLMAQGMALGQQIVLEHQPELERAVAERQAKLDR